MRTAPVLAAALLASVLTVPTADAVGETCRGSAATIVGEPGGRITGTDGDDVIVTNGADVTKAGAGGDTVCVTGGNESVGVRVGAGPGNDTVDTSATPAFTTVVLGDGEDALWGGDGGHDVVTGAADGADRETDSVHTGNEFDLVASGERGLPDADDLDVGGGAGIIRVRSERPTGLVRAAPGAEAELQLASFGPGRWVIDEPAEQVTRNGATIVAWENLAVRLIRTRPGAHLHYLGTQGRDLVYLHGAGVVDELALRGGNDRVEFHSTGPVAGTVAGGPGKDEAFVVADEVFADLRGGEFRIGPGRVAGRIGGVEDLDVQATTATVHGTNAPNLFELDACRVVIRAGGGSDGIASFASRGGDPCEDTQAISVKLFGGPGNDHLSGSALPESLYGGPGMDTARGYGGHDVCRAEKEWGCEA